MRAEADVNRSQSVVVVIMNEGGNDGGEKVGTTDMPLPSFPWHGTVASIHRFPIRKG